MKRLCSILFHLKIGYVPSSHRPLCLYQNQLGLGCTSASLMSLSQTSHRNSIRDYSMTSIWSGLTSSRRHHGLEGQIKELFSQMKLSATILSYRSQKRNQRMNVTMKRRCIRPTKQNQVVIQMGHWTELYTSRSHRNNQTAEKWRICWC